MNVVKARFEIISPMNEDYILGFLEEVGRTCYQSEPKGDSRRFVKGIIRRKHFSILEHISLSIRFTVDRGVTHEMVRHRVTSPAQESTRYCNYSQGKFDNEVTYIDLSEGIELCPVTSQLTLPAKVRIMQIWTKACLYAEQCYLEMINEGASPQIARSVLNSSTKSSLVVTANLREWRHICSLRAIGTTGKPHPQMLEVAQPLLDFLIDELPTIFEDLNHE